VANEKHPLASDPDFQPLKCDHLYS